MGERVPYQVAGQVARGVLRRAAGAGLTTKEHRVLEAVVAHTALYSRLWDRVYLAQLAAHAHGVDEAERWMLEKTRLALKRLADEGLVTCQPPRGRPPAGSKGPAYLVVLVPQEHHPSTGGLSEDDEPETPPVDGWTSDRETPPDPVRNTTRSRMETPPVGGGPTEKTFREDSREQPPPDPVDLETRRRIREKQAAGIEVGHGLRKLIRQDVERDLAADAHLDQHPTAPTADDYRESAAGLGRNWALAGESDHGIRAAVRRDLVLARFPELEDVAIEAARAARCETTATGATP